MKPKKQFTIAQSNSRAMTGAEWELIAPYGEFPSADRKRLQVFGQTEADLMVANFNSIWKQMGNMFRGVPIYHGHPDVDPKHFPDDRRLGKITELEAREDGLYGKPEFNALGRENKEEGWWVYPSPAWLSPQTNEKRIHPDELLSIGLTNTPNIFESQPWTNSAELDEDETNTDNIMKEKACALLGLDPAKATDEEILSGLENLKKMADENAAKAAEANDDKTKVINLEAEKKKAEEEALLAKQSEANSRKVFAEEIVAAAVDAGKITATEKETTLNSLIADGADVVSISKGLREKQVQLNTKQLDLGGKKIAISNARERSAAVQIEVNARMAANNCDYDTAYKSVKNDPKFAQLFEAMKQPGQAAE